MGIKNMQISKVKVSVLAALLCCLGFSNARASCEATERNENGRLVSDIGSLPAGACLADSPDLASSQSFADQNYEDGGVQTYATKKLAVQIRVPGQNESTSFDLEGYGEAFVKDDANSLIGYLTLGGSHLYSQQLSQSRGIQLAQGHLACALSQIPACDQ